MKKSFDLTGNELSEFESIVKRSGLNQSEYIRRCILPSQECRIIFLDGSRILENLGLLYQQTQSNTDFSEIVSGLFVLNVSIGRSGIGKDSYTLNLSAGGAKLAVKVKVSDKALNSAVTAKVTQKYDVVTKKLMPNCMSAGSSRPRARYKPGRSGASP